MRGAVLAGLALLSWLFWFDPPRSFPPETPLPRQMRELVYGPTHRDYAALWLVALAVPRLTIADGGKYAGVLEIESEDPAGWRVYRTPVRNPAPAVLVSRPQWKRLTPVRSLYDRAALAAYIQWANRPEAAGFRWLTRREAEVRADLGPDDMILVRRFADGWSASVPAHRDPIGYLLLDPPGPGWTTIRLTAPVFPPSPRAWPEHIIPEVNAGGIVRFPGDIITIYGQDLGGPDGRTRVFAAGREAEVLWAGPHQVNARLPRGLPSGPIPLAVEYGGGRSRPILLEAGR